MGPRASSGPYIQEVIYMGWVQLSSLVRPKKHGTACAIGPKGEARTFEPRVPSGYLTASNGYIVFPYHPLVRPKRHGTTCAIGPKGEARTHRPRAPSVPKVKLGHSNRVRHRVILPLVMAILGFLTIPWLGPKDTEPRAPTDPKAKLGHTDRVRHRSQRRS